MSSAFGQQGARAKIALAIVCICCGVAIVLQLLSLRVVFQGVRPVSAWSVLLLSVPTAFFIFIFVRVAQKGDGFALSIAVGLAPAMLLHIALFIAAVTAITLFALLRSPTSYWWMLPDLAVLEIAALIGLIMNRSRSSLLTKMLGIALGLMAGWIFANVMYALPDVGREPYFEGKAVMEERGARASEVIKAASRCLTEFKNSTPEKRFPSSLEEFERAERSCMGSAFKKGRESNAQFQYSSSPDGQHFSFHFVLPQVAGKYPMRSESFYLDDWGLITMEDKVPAFEDFAQISDADGFTTLLYGLEYFGGQHYGAYPGSLDMLSTHLPPAVRSNLKRVDPNTVEYRDYTIYYSIFYDHGRASFVLEARPRPDGRTGLSSYYADQTGVIHATSQPRSATVADPVIAKCESSKLKPCNPAAVLTK